MRISSLLVLLLLLLWAQQVKAQVAGTLVDPRDGTNYATVQYELKGKSRTQTVTWMAQNLNYRTDSSYCPHDADSLCAIYGRYYSWYEALAVCPPGWHLPTDEEWAQLAELYGGLAIAGKHIKSKGLAKGTNKSGFNGLLGGTRDAVSGQYYQLGKAGFFWSATPSADLPNEASDWSFASWDTQLRHWEGVKSIGNSCRCVKD